LAALAGGGRRRRPDRNGESYLDAAEEAAKGGEWGRVFGMLEVAAKLGVTEARREALEKLQRTAGRELAGICMRQSRFAESTGDLAAALRHAEEGVRYAPDDAESWHAVARFRLRQGRDLHQARDAAMKAIGIVPRAPAYRITLARIYLAAGLHKSARREAEQVLQAAGDNEEAKAILAEAGRATG
jgi:tetratricopeptide (TPR) repeat protein